MFVSVLEALPVAQETRPHRPAHLLHTARYVITLLYVSSLMYPNILFSVCPTAAFYNCLTHCCFLQLCPTVSCNCVLLFPATVLLFLAAVSYYCFLCGLPLFPTTVILLFPTTVYPTAVSYNCVFYVFLQLCVLLLFPITVSYCFFFCNCVSYSCFLQLCPTAVSYNCVSYCCFLQLCVLQMCPAAVSYNCEHYCRFLQLWILLCFLLPFRTALSSYCCVLLLLYTLMLCFLLLRIQLLRVVYFTVMLLCHK